MVCTWLQRNRSHVRGDGLANVAWKCPKRLVGGPEFAYSGGCLSGRLHHEAYGQSSLFSKSAEPLGIDLKEFLCAAER